MKKMTMTIAVLMMILLAAGAFAEQKDTAGCKDHPLFTRMPGSWIHSCTEKQFDSYAFPVGKGKTTQVEGQVWKINYYPNADIKQKPSELQIQRNFENAIVKAGGTVVWNDKTQSTLKLVKDGKEIWVALWAEFTGKYGLTIVQKDAMAQDIVVDAAALADGLKTTGHIAVYDILFDTGKSVIKPESDQAIGEIAKLLTADPALKIYVVGHTDNEGTLDGNMKLSQARGEAVLQALVRDHGIAAARLKAFGVGPLAPVASNDTADGKAKNRRVELVKP